MKLPLSAIVISAFVSAIAACDDAADKLSAGQAGEPSFRLRVSDDVVGRHNYVVVKFAESEIGRAAWPFSTPTVHLVCLREYGPGGAFFIVGDQPFAATGAAATLARTSALTFEGLAEARRSPLLFSVDEPSAAALWRQVAPVEGVGAGAVGPRISLEPLFSKIDKLGCR